MSEIREELPTKIQASQNLATDSQSNTPIPDHSSVRKAVPETGLDDAVRATVGNFLAGTEGDTLDLYDLLIREVEAPLLEAVMNQTGYNQSRAAGMLGLNRGTLRKKLKRYGFI